MKTIKINPTGINNFHNSGPLAVRVTGQMALGMGEDLYVISRQQALRIKKHFCGVTGCRCPAGGVVVETSSDGNKFGLRIRRMT